MSFEKMNLRSSAPPIEEPKYKRKVPPGVSTFPFLTYNGKIEYCTDAIDCAFSCDNLLQMANNSLEDFILGFDMEWPFNFKTGSDKTALIQIAPSLNMCYLYHVTKFKKLPVVLTELLSHNKVKIVGVNIKNDIRKLSRDFPGVNSLPIINNCIDLRPLARSVVQTLPSYSMKTLVNHFLEMQINKSKDVRNSKWNILPLSKAQMEYAAIDASLKLYLHLKDLQVEVKQLN